MSLVDHLDELRARLVTCLSVFGVALAPCFRQNHLACGIVFQVQVGILAVTRLGIVKVQQLISNRRYAYLVCAVVAAALPGVDPVSMLLEMAPLIVLYEISIVLAKVFGTPAERVEAAPQGS
jgi:sec-independent protein translocase protein TatC